MYAYNSRSPADVKKQLEKLRLFVNSNKQILKDKARILADHANHKALVKKISTEISDVEEVFEVNALSKMKILLFMIFIVNGFIPVTLFLFPGLFSLLEDNIFLSW